MIQTMIISGQNHTYLDLYHSYNSNVNKNFNSVNSDLNKYFVTNSYKESKSKLFRKMIPSYYDIDLLHKYQALQGQIYYTYPQQSTVNTVKLLMNRYGNGILSQAFVQQQLLFLHQSLSPQKLLFNSFWLKKYFLIGDGKTDPHKSKYLKKLFLNYNQFIGMIGNTAENKVYNDDIKNSFKTYDNISNIFPNLKDKNWKATFIDINKDALNKNFEEDYSKFPILDNRYDPFYSIIFYKSSSNEYSYTTSSINKLHWNEEPSKNLIVNKQLVNTNIFEGDVHSASNLYYNIDVEFSVFGSSNKLSTMTTTAYVTNIKQDYSAQWNQVNYLGKILPVGIYSGYSKTVNFDITLVQEDNNDNINNINNKLSKLIAMIFPNRTSDNIMIGKFINIKIGNNMQYYGILKTVSMDVSFQNTPQLPIENSNNIPLMYELSISLISLPKQYGGQDDEFKIQ